MARRWPRWSTRQRNAGATRPRNTRVPPQAASDAEVAAFIAEYQRAERPEILQGWIKALKKHFRGMDHGTTAR